MVEEKIKVRSWLQYAHKTLIMVMGNGLEGFITLQKHLSIWWFRRTNDLFSHVTVKTDHIHRMIILETKCKFMQASQPNENPAISSNSDTQLRLQPRNSETTSREGNISSDNRKMTQLSTAQHRNSSLTSREDHKL